MTDVVRKCPDCGAEVTVSSLAEGFFCAQCRRRIALPAAPPATTASGRPPLRLRTGEGLLNGSTEKPPPETGDADAPGPVRRRAAPRRSASASAYHIGSWIVFLVLGGALAALRYGPWLTTAQLGVWKSTAPFVFLALHVIVVLTAFHDTVFSGILSLLIPPYAYYYLFALADNFYLRALAGGLLVGIGQDSAAEITLRAGDIAHRIDAYIRSGG